LTHLTLGGIRSNMKQQSGGKSIRSKPAGMQRMAVVAITTIGITGFFAFFDLDLSISRIFFSSQNGWYLGDSQPWRFLYYYGTIPGLTLTIVALIGSIFVSVIPWLRSCRRHMLLILLVSVFGAGIIVNGILKPYWGRPRPRQVTEFSGQWEFHHPYRPGIPGKGQSFPCGHCTMGFLFTTFFFARDRRRWVALVAGSFGVIYGLLIGIGRIIQGAHFATDVIWSFGVILLTAMVMHYVAVPRLEAITEKAKGVSLGRKWFRGAAVTLLAVMITLTFLTRRPFYYSYLQPVTLSDGINEWIIESNVEFEVKDIRYADTRTGRLTVGAHGFGWFNISHGVGFKEIAEGNKLRTLAYAVSKGYFSELSYRTEICLPNRFKDKVNIRFETRTAGDYKVPKIR